MEGELISKKKPTFPVSDDLNRYLTEYGRNLMVFVSYDDLLRFQGSVAVYDKRGHDTLWLRLYYADYEREEIENSLKKIYAILHVDGSADSLSHLTIDAIDFCSFGNTKPFRVKVRNILNDNYTYLYIKKADASRIYGLELEHILSPNRINFLVYGNTLVEEHILGIPGDTFIQEQLSQCSQRDQRRIAKEFVKFNERCIIRLLGDMRSYNYVVVPTHDYDQVQYRIRAIDFDQQSYEGSLKVYRPQFFKENYPFVKMTSGCLQETSVMQYKKEERSLLAKRIISSHNRLDKLLKCMIKDSISSPDKTDRLRREFYEYTLHNGFKKCSSMGEILKCALDFVVCNYENVNTYLIH